MQTNYGAQKIELLITVFENFFRLLVRYLYLNPDPKVFVCMFTFSCQTDSEKAES